MRYIVIKQKPVEYCIVDAKSKKEAIDTAEYMGEYNEISGSIIIAEAIERR